MFVLLPAWPRIPIHRDEPTGGDIAFWCWCSCGLVTLMHGTLASGLQVEESMSMGTAAAFALALSYVPPQSDRAKAPRSATSHKLEREHTSTSACGSGPPPAASIVLASDLQNQLLSSLARPTSFCSRHSALRTCP